MPLLACFQSPPNSLNPCPPTNLPCHDFMQCSGVLRSDSVASALLEAVKGEHDVVIWLLTYDVFRDDESITEMFVRCVSVGVRERGALMDASQLPPPQQLLLLHLCAAQYNLCIALNAHTMLSTFLPLAGGAWATLSLAPTAG